MQSFMLRWENDVCLNISLMIYITLWLDGSNNDDSLCDIFLLIDLVWHHAFIVLNNPKHLYIVGIIKSVPALRKMIK